MKTYAYLCSNKTIRDMQDFFETPELIPNEVQAILDKYSEMDNTYTNCDNLIDELAEIGWICEYGLSAEPYDLRPMNENKLLDLL